MIFCFKHPYSEVGVYNPSRGAGFIIILVITKSPCIGLNQKKMAIHLAKFKYFTKRVSPSNHWLKQSEDSDMFWLCFDASPPSLSMNSTTDISFKKGRLVGDNSQFLDFWDDVRCHYTSPRKMVFHNTCFQIHRLPLEISVFFSMALWITWMRNYTNVDPKQFIVSKFRLKPVILISECFVLDAATPTKKGDNRRQRETRPLQSPRSRPHQPTPRRPDLKLH